MNLISVWGHFFDVQVYLLSNYGEQNQKPFVINVPTSFTYFFSWYGVIMPS